MQRQYLLKKDPHDERDLKLTTKRIKLPESFDLRESDTVPVFDQGQLGSCTANAICGFKQYIDNAEKGKYNNLSRLFLYWQERSMEGTIDQDSGAYIRDGFKALNKIGCAAEQFFPYVISTFTYQPSAAAMQDAPSNVISAYHRVNTVLQLKQELFAGRPVVLGIDVYESFESDEVARTGIVPLPKKSKEQLLGGHAVLAMGFKKIDGKPYIIVKNSWGPHWGDKGYFYLPETFFKPYVSDMWTGLN